MSGLGLTDDDLERLGRIDAHPTHEVGETEPDQVDLPPEYDKEVHKVLGRNLSRQVVAYSHDHTNEETAEHFGISERTVERHRATWLGFDDVDTVKFDRIRYIDSRVCAVMREMGHDGVPMSDIAGRFDCSKGAVHNHVSIRGGCNCNNEVPRVTYE